MKNINRRFCPDFFIFTYNLSYVKLAKILFQLLGIFFVLENTVELNLLDSKNKNKYKNKKKLYKTFKGYGSLKMIFKKTFFYFQNLFHEK